MDEQQQLDQQDAAFRLRRLVLALIDRANCEELVRYCESELRRARSKLRQAIRHEQELAFVERNKLPPCEGE